ncbi:MAG: single-stranded-DNA-specific exonuclease RecJ [Clostridia bacterium]|nr:single-stranded-DNA-specific exonuclease RecJ [Clostridia bacterium]
MQIKVNVLNQNINMPSELINAAGGDELIARIFYNRGYTEAELVRQMLDDRFYKPTETDEFPNMDIAVKRIAGAIQKGEKIAVYGDYDVDGVTSTVCLVQCLRKFTSKVVYHVPDRFTEGYGMNEEVVRSLAQIGTRLIITCDCGISNHSEISAAKSLGIDVIVTDHHRIPDNLPPADVVLNPRLLPEGHRARNISGCAMAYFLCLALHKHFGCDKNSEEYLDMLALSIVADVVSLSGENRYLLKKAMPVLFNTGRTGLKALFAAAGKGSKLETEEDIAFQLAPRINAAGRMDTARLPVELFLTSDARKAEELASRIDTLNKERKKIQQEIIDQALEMVENGKKSRTILVLYGDRWHHGIIGIAAGKICETYRKPVILLTLKEDGRTVVGSARSIEEIDIYELIKECGSRLLKFGGHSAAAGLSLDKSELAAFTREIEKLAESKYQIKDTVAENADMELKLRAIDDEMYEKLRGIGPFGEGFEQPVFYTRRVSVVSDRKTDSNHHIMVLEDEDRTRVQAVKWFGEDSSLEGKSFDITYTVGRSNYKGSSSLQLTVGNMIGVQSRPGKVFEGRFEDRRGIDIKCVLKEFADAAVFYEGLSSLSPVHAPATRYDLRKAGSIIFASTPANTQLLKEAVLLTDPEIVILNFSVIPDYTFKGFILNLMGVLKHIMAKEEGRTSIETLAVRLCVEESIIKAALKYIRAAGKIDYFQDSDDNMLFINTGNGSMGKSIHAAEKNIRNALAEKHAYQQFILKLEARRFIEYFK